MSRQIKIGNLTLGGGAPIRVQSMTNTDTMDTRATVEQALRMAEQQGVGKVFNDETIGQSVEQKARTEHREPTHL